MADEALNRDTKQRQKYFIECQSFLWFLRIDQLNSSYYLCDLPF